MGIDISVIIPTHNNERTIARSVDSILSQSFMGSFEIVVVADNCTDKTPDVIRSIQKDHPNVVLVEAKNGSSILSRLCGAKRAQGEYLMFLDGDDTYHIDALKILFETAKKHNADMVNAGVYYVKPDKTKKMTFRRNAVYNHDGAIRAILWDVFLKGFMPTKIYRRKLFLDMGYTYPVGNNMYEDFLLNFIFLLNPEVKKVVTLRACTLFYDKTNENSLTTAVKNRAQDDIDCRAKMRQVMEEMGQSKALKTFRFLKPRVNGLLFADFLLTKYPSKEAKKIAKAQAKADMKKIYGKATMPLEGQSYTPYLLAVHKEAGK